MNAAPNAAALMALLARTHQGVLQGQMPGQDYVPALANFVQNLRLSAQQAAPQQQAVAPAPRQTAAPSTQGLTPGGGWGGSEGPIQYLTSLTRPFGLRVNGGKRNNLGPGGNPLSGSRSDHHTGNKSAFANDIGWGGSRPTPQSDRAASAIVEALGGPRNWGSRGGNFRATVNGVRYQVLYRTNVGGNHWNHIHVGGHRV